MLEQYLQMFAKLRTDKGRDRYPGITWHRAPHKPFRLLSVMDLIAQGRITENLIEPSYEGPRGRTCYGGQLSIGLRSSHRESGGCRAFEESSGMHLPFEGLKPL
jgi:hypothetical protein